MEIDRNYIIPRFNVVTPIKDIEILNSDTNEIVFKSTSDGVLYNQTLSLKLPKFLAEYKKFHQMNFKFEINMDFDTTDSIPIKLLVHKEQGSQQTYVRNGTRHASTLKILDSTKIIMIRFPQIMPHQTITVRNPSLNVIEDITYSSLHSSLIPILLIGGTNKTYMNIDKIRVHQLITLEDVYCYYLRINLHKLGKFAISIPASEFYNNNDEVFPQVSDIIVLHSNLSKTLREQLKEVNYKRLCVMNIDKLKPNVIDNIKFVKPDVFLSTIQLLNQLKCNNFFVGIGTDDKVFRPDKRNSDLTMFIDVCDSNIEQYRQIVDVCYEYIANDLSDDGMTEQTMTICRNASADKEFRFDDDYVKNGRYVTVNEKVTIKLSNKLNTSRIYISTNPNPVDLKYVSAIHSGCFIISPIDFEKYGFPIKKGEEYEMIDNITTLQLNKIARNTDYNSIKEKINSFNWLNVSNRILSFVNHVEDIVKYTETITRQTTAPVLPVKPTPTPITKSQPIVKPTPVPAPVVKPAPKPQPTSKQTPIVKSAPKPQPTPKPTPVVKPAPKPQPIPAPVGGKKALALTKGRSKRDRANATKSKKSSQLVGSTPTQLRKPIQPVVTGKRGAQIAKANAKSKRDLQQTKKGKR
jgi:hypothetical protein